MERPLQEGRYNWEEIGESWVLRPRASAPEAIVHFLGGAFIGVAPQLAYRQFLEAIADRNILVIATPFSTHFDHLRSAEESHYKFEQTMERLKSKVPNLSNLPVYGLGHSLGALLHLLISSKYAIHRDGNILISFNNKPATEVRVLSVKYVKCVIGGTIVISNCACGEILKSFVNASCHFSFPTYCGTHSRYLPRLESFPRASSHSNSRTIPSDLLRRCSREPRVHPVSWRDPKPS